MKTQKGKYVPIDCGFSVEVPKEFAKKRFEWKPSAVYITHDHSMINLHYSGERAGESMAIFELPTNSEFLRKLASALLELADEYDEDA